MCTNGNVFKNGICIVQSGCLPVKLQAFTRSNKNHFKINALLPNYPFWNIKGITFDCIFNLIQWEHSK